MRIDLPGEVLLDGTDNQDATYTLTKVKGVLDGGSMRREQVDRPSQHGQFSARGYLGGGLIMLEGEIYSRGYADQDAAIARLLGSGAAGGIEDITAHLEGGSWRARAGRVGKPDITPDVMGLVARYSMEWWAPDPRWYGEMNEAPPASTITLSHLGNFEALPELTITGSSPGGYTITGPSGELVTITRALVPGQPHTFSMRTARLSVGGVPVLGGIAVSQLWTVPPYVTVSASVSAGAQLAGKVADTSV